MAKSVWFKAKLSSKAEVGSPRGRARCRTLGNPGWHPARLVYYIGGKLDLTVIRADALRTIRRERPFTIPRGQRRYHRFTAPGGGGDFVARRSGIPGATDWGYAAALMCAKAIVRDEPWSGKIRDRDLKASLVTFIEWDHHVRHGLDHDVRFLGSRMRQWMDADVQQALEQCWGHFDAADSAKALRASIAKLGRRISDSIGFRSFNHDRVQREVEAVLEMHSDAR